MHLNLPIPKSNSQNMTSKELQLKKLNISRPQSLHATAFAQVTKDFSKQQSQQQRLLPKRQSHQSEQQQPVKQTDQSIVYSSSPKTRCSSLSNKSTSLLGFTSAMTSTESHRKRDSIEEFKILETASESPINKLIVPGKIEQLRSNFIKREQLLAKRPNHNKTQSSSNNSNGTSPLFRLNLDERERSEDELFSTSRRERRAYELLKNKVFRSPVSLGNSNNNSEIGVIPRVSEKMLSKTSYLTNKLNKYYEHTMGLVSQIESRKLSLNIPSILASTQYSFANTSLNANSKCLNTTSNNKQSSDHNNKDLNYLVITKPQTQPIELISKKNVVNMVKAQPFEFFYVFIETKSMATPLRVMISAPLQKVRTFVSKSTPFPSNFSHDYVSQSTSIRVDDAAKRQFSFSTVFLGVVSQMEQEIGIQTFFGDSAFKSPESSIYYHPEIRSPFNDSMDLFHNTSSADCHSSYPSRSPTRQLKMPLRELSTPVLAQNVGNVLSFQQFNQLFCGSWKNSRNQSKKEEALNASHKRWRNQKL